MTEKDLLLMLVLINNERLMTVVALHYISGYDAVSLLQL